MEMMDRRNKEDQVTMLVTHDPVAASYCNRVVFIKDGQLYNEITYGESQSAFYQKSSMCYRRWEVRDMNFRQFAINNVLRASARILPIS